MASYALDRAAMSHARPLIDKHQCMSHAYLQHLDDVAG
jgi:hypothetical protein